MRPIKSNFPFSSGTECGHKSDTPMDEFPLRFDPDLAQEIASPWVIGNICRMASQVLVGLEFFELMAVVEAIVKTKTGWLPFSFHHDGLAFFAEEDKLAESKATLEKVIAARVEPFGLRPIKLHITEYTPISGEEIDLVQKQGRRRRRRLNGRRDSTKKSINRARVSFPRHLRRGRKRKTTLNRRKESKM